MLDISLVAHFFTDEVPTFTIKVLNVSEIYYLCSMILSSNFNLVFTGLYFLLLVTVVITSH